MANQNTDIDFESLAVQAIKRIDGIRSKSKFGTIIPGESRINAFYRALGLPAVIRVNEENNTNESDPNNVANVFSSEDNQSNNSLNFDDFASDFQKREAFVLNESIPLESKDSFLYFNKANVAGGILDGEMARIGGSLKPFVVSGEIDIFPQKRRVGGAFLTENELELSGVKYKRPLLETIILMKLKGVGIVDPNTQSNLQLPSAPSSKAISGINEGLSGLTQVLVENLEGALRSFPEIIARAANEIQNASLRVKNKVEPERIPEQHPVTSSVTLDDSELGELDKRESGQNSEKVLRESILGLFEFDDIFGDGINNMKAGYLASEILIGSATFKEDGTEKENKRELEEKKEAVNKKLKKNYKILELALGVFSGISGIDIMVIVTALLKMDITYLIGLLNQKSKDRLALIKGQDIVNSSKRVKESLSKLEETVDNLFKEHITSQMSEINWDNYIVNQKRGG